MTEFIDTHTHLYDEAFSGESDAAIARAEEAGVTRMVFPDIDSKTREEMFAVADRHPGTVFPCLGLHPTSIDSNWREEYGKMLEWADRKVYAIGEIGMDCYWSREFVEEQKEALKAQLRLAHEKGLPVIIHSESEVNTCKCLPENTDNISLTLSENISNSIDSSSSPVPKSKFIKSPVLENHNLLLKLFEPPITNLF